MNLANYYYHTILKDSLTIEDIYHNFEQILKDGFIKSRKLLISESNVATYNGNEYISIAEYNVLSPYKTFVLKQKDFKKSKLSILYETYDKYLDNLKLYEFLEEPLSKEQFFLKNNTQDKRDYFNYLDKITRTYPVDIKNLYEKTQDPIYKDILNISKSEIIYCYPSENAFNKFVLETNGITFVFPHTINVVDVTIIPNLPFEIEKKLVEKISNLSKRYSNIIGEKQVKDKIDLSTAVGVLLKNNIDKNKIIKLLDKYNYHFPVYTINKEGLDRIN